MKKMYSIWDSKAEEFCPPFVAKNDKMATRMFLQSIKGIPYSEDMKLYCVGSFDSENNYEPLGACPVVAVPLDLVEVD